MGPSPTYGGGYSSEDDEIPCHCDRSGRPRGPAYDGDDEASEYTAHSRGDWDTHYRPSPRRYAHYGREARQPRGGHSSRSRPLEDDDDVLYYAKYRNPAKDLPIERDPEGINMSKVRQHTRPSRARESSGYRESYKVRVDEYEADLPPRTRPGRCDSRQPEAYRVQVEEYEDDLPPRTRTGRRESTQPGQHSSRYADNLGLVDLPSRSGTHGSSRFSPMDEDIEYEIREPRGYRSSLYAAGDDPEPGELPPRSGPRTHSRSSGVDKAVKHEIRERRRYCSGRAARGDDSYEDHSSTHIHIEDRGPRGFREGGRRRESTYGCHGRGQDPDDSDEVDAQARKFTDMLPDMFSKFNINPDR
ncbi:hypothetical protein BDV10DRAFT_188830 [Aspergillus recurvatus]